MAVNINISDITGINQVGNSYQRKSAVPLDYYSLFNSLAEAQEYANSNPVAYVGQILTVTESNSAKLYLIINTNGDLKALGDIADLTQDYTGEDYEIVFNCGEYVPTEASTE